MVFISYPHAKSIVTDLLSGINRAAEAGRLPLHVTQGLDELYQNYRNAVN